MTHETRALNDAASTRRAPRNTYIYKNKTHAYYVPLRIIIIYARRALCIAMCRMCLSRRQMGASSAWERLKYRATTKFKLYCVFFKLILLEAVSTPLRSTWLVFRKHRCLPQVGAVSIAIGVRVCACGAVRSESNQGRRRRQTVGAALNWRSVRFMRDADRQPRRPILHDHAASGKGEEVPPRLLEYKPWT